MFEKPFPINEKLIFNLMLPSLKNVKFFSGKQDHLNVSKLNDLIKTTKNKFFCGAP